MARERRTHTQHPGVKIKRLKRTGTWVARYVNPDTGKETQTSLTALGLSNAARRRRWAIAKSKEIKANRANMKAGITPETQTKPKDAIRAYYESVQGQLKPKTLEAYRQASVPFVEWCEREGLRAIEKLTPAKLALFRDQLAKTKRAERRTGKGAKGMWKKGSKERSPFHTNKLLNGLRVILNNLRKRGFLPSLTSDEIAESLAYVKTPKTLPRFLTVAQIKQLMHAASEHDAKLDDGKGHHHPVIKDFILAALLTGMRFSELAELQWEHVDLEAWEIRLPHTLTKTQQARVVGLRECPSLHELLKQRQGSSACKFVFGLGNVNSKGKTVYTGFRKPVAEAARKRLMKKHKAPQFTWHDLRRTCGTYLACAPGIYGGASVFLSAKRLGHLVAVSERNYAGHLSSLPAKARTLEEVMDLPLPLEYMRMVGEEVVV